MVSSSLGRLCRATLDEAGTEPLSGCYLDLHKFRRTAWFKINYNLAQTKRLISSSDPIYQKTVDLRMALYGSSDLVFGYWEIHGLRWEGDKAAIRYLSNHDPNFLNLLQQFLVETGREIKFDLYERLAAMATAPMGWIWPDGATAMTFDLESVTPETVEHGLEFWGELVSD